MANIFHLDYRHSKEELDVNAKFVPQPNTDISEVRASQLIMKKLTDDADIFNPVGSTGWRTSDIDIIQNPESDPRHINVVASRLAATSKIASIGDSNHEGIDDDTIADMVIPQGLNYSDVNSLLSSIDSNKLELDRLISLRDNPPDSIAEPKSE